MAVYVDPNMEWPNSARWPYGSVSHMYADTPEELHTLAKKIGLKRTWCSDHTQPGSRLLHYDLSPGKRERALAAGAIPKDFFHKMQFYPVDDPQYCSKEYLDARDAKSEQQEDSGRSVHRPARRRPRRDVGSGVDGEPCVPGFDD